MYKVGIISRKGHRNFGNILQLTALSEAVKALGYAPVIADYAYHGWLQPFQPVNPLRASARMLKRVIKPQKTQSKQELYNEARREKFRRFFETQTCMSEPMFTASELFFFSETCDAFISGSDQVWAPMWFDPRYCLDFVAEDAKKIAYAASFGRDHVDPPAIAARMAHDIAAYAHISVREQSGVRLVRELTGREAEWTLDPTLLLSAEDYRKYERGDCVPDRPYLLCYFLGGRAQNWARARTIADANGLAMAVIPFLTGDAEQGDIAFPEAGPEDFLALFRGASFVCTDSFHGTVFSLQYRRPFVAFERNENKAERMSTRIASLLELTGLERRFIGDGALDMALCRQTIDFEDAHRRVAAARAQSMDFLRRALERACAAPRTAPYQITNTCCGCGACAAACPKGAVSIRRDNQGFRAAVVDQDRCVRCGRCRGVCPYVRPSQNALMDMKGLYAFKADDETLRRSSSGGFACMLGEHLAAQSYPMAGCVYDAENRRAVHRVAAPGDAALRLRFCGSKYIQSDLAEVFAAIRGGLERALFVGTPCQVAAVARLLGERRRDWVLVELICHGVPSDALFEKYIDDLDRRFGVGTTPEVLFRDKRLGWKPSRMNVRGDGGHYEAAHPDDPFLRLFLMDFALRESCHECLYRKASEADLRIGDYWGKRYKSDNTGVSMVAALTDRGAALVEALAQLPGVFCEQHPEQDYIDGQAAYKNARIPTERGAVLEALNDPAVSMAAIRRKWIAPRDRQKRYHRAYTKVKKLLGR